MNSPFTVALREFASRLAILPKEPAEAIAARSLVRHIDELAANLEGEATSVDLVSVICHDLKDPLASIAMGTGYLRKGGELPESKQRVVEAMGRSAERMNRIVTDLHEIARLEAGRITLDQGPCDLGLVLRSAVKPFAGTAQERRIDLRVDLPAEAIPTTCDAPRVERIVACLVGTALLATPKDGRVSLWARPTPEEVRVAVSDTGSPIPAERLPDAFEHVSSSQRVRDGLGLELAIARALVELHGGTITATSSGNGEAPLTTFAFTLPRR
jgi:signal transduction histidine kinase